jgi:hypothetical protein
MMDRTLRIFLITLVLYLASCAGGTSEQSDGTPSPSQPALPGNGGAIGSPPSLGGGASPISPTPNVPRLPTSTGGYFSITKVMQYTVDSSLKLIGAVFANGGSTILFERTASTSLRFWDIYHIDDSGRIGLPVCSMLKPQSSSSYFQGLAFNGTDYMIFGYSDSWPVYARLFKIDMVNCRATLYRDMYSSSNWSPYKMALSYYGGRYYHVGSGIFTFDVTSGVSQSWMYSPQAIAGINPSPVRTNFCVDSLGRSWFSDYMDRLWMGSAVSGTWRGWGELPVSQYLDLYQTKFIFGVDANTIKLVTIGDYSTQMRIYDLHVSSF